MNTTTKNEQAQRATLGWVSDYSHSWLAITLDSEHGYPDAINYASQWSYVDLTGDNFAGIVYLEEDADAPAFIRATGIKYLSLETFNLPEDNTLRNLTNGVAYRESITN